MFFSTAAPTDITSFSLVAESIDHIGIRSNKGNAVVGALLSKASVLTEETVTGMDHGDIMQLGDADNLILGQVSGHRSEL